MSDALIESFRNAPFGTRPIRRQTHGEIAVAERQHGGEELPGPHRGWIVSKMLSIAGGGRI